LPRNKLLTKRPTGHFYSGYIDFHTPFSKGSLKESTPTVLYNSGTHKKEMKIWKSAGINPL